jgi:hypothetical protein
LQALVVVPIPSFVPSARRMEFPLFDGAQGLSCIHSEDHCISVHCVGRSRFPNISRVVDCWDSRKDMTLL